MTYKKENKNKNKRQKFYIKTLLIKTTPKQQNFHYKKYEFT